MRIKTAIMMMQNFNAHEIPSSPGSSGTGTGGVGVGVGGQDS